MCVRINKGDAKRLLKNGKRRVNHSLPVQKNIIITGSDQGTCSQLLHFYNNNNIS